MRSSCRNRIPQQCGISWALHPPATAQRCCTCQSPGQPQFRIRRSSLSPSPLRLATAATCSGCRSGRRPSVNAISTSRNNRTAQVENTHQKCGRQRNLGQIPDSTTSASRARKAEALTSGADRRYCPFRLRLGQQFKLLSFRRERFELLLLFCHQLFPTSPRTGPQKLFVGTASLRSRPRPAAWPKTCHFRCSWNSP